VAGRELPEAGSEPERGTITDRDAPDRGRPSALLYLYIGARTQTCMSTGGNRGHEDTKRVVAGQVSRWDRFAWT